MMFLQNGEEITLNDWIETVIAFPDHSTDTTFDKTIIGRVVRMHPRDVKAECFIIEDVKFNRYAIYPKYNPTSRIIPDDELMLMRLSGKLDNK